MSGLKYKVVLVLVLAFTAPTASGCTFTVVCDPALHLRITYATARQSNSCLR